MSHRDYMRSSNAVLPRHLVQHVLNRLGYELRKAPFPYVLDIDFEYVLADFLGQRIDPRPVSFVEIGAFDGVEGDPLHEHVVRKGWHGILVEPHRALFEQLRRNYADQEGLCFVNAAVSAKSGETTFYAVDLDAPDVPDWARGLSTLSLEMIHRWKHRWPAIEEHLKPQTVKSVTFDDLLEISGTRYVDLVQIDTEGHDFEVLKLIDLDRVKPAIVRFEHAHLSSGDYRQAINLLGHHGYRLIRDTERDTTAYLRPAS